MAKLTVTVTRRLPAPVEARLARDFTARLNADDTPLDADAIVAACRGADVLLPTVTDRIDAALIARLPESVRLIANFGAGTDHIDRAAAAKCSIPVTNTPDVLTDDTADLAMALILAAARRLGEGERLVRAGGWTGWTPTFMTGTRVAGRALGIIGMGRIGLAVARRARGFNMAVHYHNRRRVPMMTEIDLAARFWDDLDAMLAEVDFVSIHCPKTTETDGLFSAERLARMKPGAVLVNTARGGIVDEAALAAALRSGPLAAAGLDVYQGEPRVHPDLLKLENVVLAPHLGSATRDGRVAMGERAIANIAAFAAGKPLPNEVTG